MSLNSRLDKDKSIPIIRNTGLDVDEKIIAPRIHETVKSVTAKFTAEKLLTERPIVKANIDRSMRESLSKYHIILEDVQLTDFRFSREFDAAIEAKQTEVQRTLKAKNILERTKKVVVSMSISKPLKNGMDACRLLQVAMLYR